MYLGCFLMSLSIYDTTYLGCFSWHYIPGLFFDVTKYLGFFLWHYLPRLFFMTLHSWVVFKTLCTWVIFYDITNLGGFFNDITYLCLFFMILHTWVFFFLLHYVPGLFLMTLRNPSRAISTCFSLEPCVGGWALFWFSIMRECRYCAWDPMKSNRSIVKPLGFCQINDTRKLV